MNSRIRSWTKADLDRVWPPPDGRHWRLSDVLGWVIETDDEENCVWADGDRVCGSDSLEVVIAVASVALGLDSRASLAAAIEKAGDTEEMTGKAAGGTSIATGMARRAEAYRAAAVVRSGRVSP